MSAFAVKRWDDVATKINKLHLQANEHAESAVACAKIAGELLLEQKATIGHGGWAAWLTSNVKFSERTARNYMRIARELPKLPEEKRQRVAEMPLRRVAAEISIIKGEIKRENKQRVMAKEEASNATSTSHIDGGPHSHGGNRKSSDNVRLDQHDVDLWSSAKLILEAKTKARSINSARRKRLREDLQRLVGHVPDYLRGIAPDSALAEAIKRRDEAVAEARRRADELIAWVDEQNKAINQPLLEAAQAADESPDILIGREVHYPNVGIGIQADVFAMGIPVIRMEHFGDDCECSGAVRFGALGTATKREGAP